jgi:hypothetical protein
MPSPDGISAIENALSRSVEIGPRGFEFKVTCQLSDDLLDKLKPPIMGVAPAGAAPGMPAGPSLSAPPTVSPVPNTPVSPKPRGQ